MKKKKKKKKERGKKHSCRESHQFTNVGRNRKTIEIQNKQRTVNPYIAITTLNVKLIDEFMSKGTECLNG